MKLFSNGNTFLRSVSVAAIGLFFAAHTGSAHAQSSTDAQPASDTLQATVVAKAAARTMPDIIVRFTADSNSLEQTYTLRMAPDRTERLRRFYGDTLQQLKAVNFASLVQEDRVDYLLLKLYSNNALHDLTVHEREDNAALPMLPYAAAIEQFAVEQREMKRPDAEAGAAALAGITDAIKADEAQWKEKLKLPGAKPDPVLARRAALDSTELRDAMHFWFDQHNGYDPAFTWWCSEPYKRADQALEAHIKFLTETLEGVSADDRTTIVGEPVGRAALEEELRNNLIPYTPEQMIAIAQTEYDWCMREMLKASREMGYGDNWHAAVEKIKSMHVPPGDQPDLVRADLQQASDFVIGHDLVTVPPLALETQRMIMMTPERQLVNPFFTGGDEISVSYPTDTMTFAQRLMSMRGNSAPLAHATVFHEMIPGHFLQFYMAARYLPYRQIFETPFWHEGNSLWWEMLMWDEGFQNTPAERVGALMWRMHRSARVIFTMNFHLGRWTSQQCVQYLIDNVGWEPANATAEVRRSFDGSVGPLYQSAYLMGGLQFRALHHELVDSGKMTNRQFHDAVLHENFMPIELLRAELLHLPLQPDYTTRWKFYGEDPVHP